MTNSHPRHIVVTLGVMTLVGFLTGCGPGVTSGEPTSHPQSAQKAGSGHQQTTAAPTSPEQQNSTTSTPPPWAGSPATPGMPESTTSSSPPWHIVNATPILTPDMSAMDPDQRCSPYTAEQAETVARSQIKPPTDSTVNKWVDDPLASVDFSCKPLSWIVISNGQDGDQARYQIALFHYGYFVGTPLSKPTNDLPDINGVFDEGVLLYVDSSTATGASSTTTTDALGEPQEYQEGTSLDYYVWDSASNRVLLTHTAPQWDN